VRHGGARGGVRQRLDPVGDIHAVTINVVAVDDDVTDIDADPELYSTVFWAAPIAFANLLLDLDRAGDSVTALANSTSAPSPVSLNVRPEWAAIRGSKRSRLMAFKRASVPASSMPMRRE